MFTRNKVTKCRKKNVCLQFFCLKRLNTGRSCLERTPLVIAVGVGDYLIKTCNREPELDQRNPRFWQVSVEPWEFYTLLSPSWCWETLESEGGGWATLVTGQRSDWDLHLIGMISWGMTGRIFLLPPLASKSSMPCREDTGQRRSPPTSRQYLDSKEDIRMLSLSETVEEER